MNKKTIILIVAIVLVIGIVIAACLLLKNKNNNNNIEEDLPMPPPITTPTEEPEMPSPPKSPGPENPEEFLHESFEMAKNVLGDEYYPNVTVNSEDIPEMFGVNPDDYHLAFAQVCDDENKVDMIVAIQGKDQEAMNRIWEALRAYANKLQEDTSYPEHVRTAMQVYITTTDIWDYVFLITTFGDLDSVADKTDEEIMQFAENNARKVSMAIKDRDEINEIANNPDKK